MSTYEPEKWVTSMHRALRDYIKGEINGSIRNSISDPGGLEVFDVVMDYPFSAASAQEVDFKKTIIHFEIDDVENIKLGIGGDIVEELFTDGDVFNPATVIETEARCHRVNFDVGVWASDLSGGSTSRLTALEILESAFGGQKAREKCMEITQGVEIFSFQSGRFLVDTINDVRVFRIVGMELIVRVYSRKDGDALIVPDEIVQAPSLTIPPLAITD